MQSLNGLQSEKGQARVKLGEIVARTPDALIPEVYTLSFDVMGGFNNLV